MVGAASQSNSLTTEDGQEGMVDGEHETLRFDIGIIDER